MMLWLWSAQRCFLLWPFALHTQHLGLGWKEAKTCWNVLLSHATTALAGLLPLCDFLVSFNLWDPAAKGFIPSKESSSVSNHAHTPISPWNPCTPFTWGKQNLCWVVDAAQGSSSAQQVEGREPGDHQDAEKYHLIGFSAFDVTQSSGSNALLWHIWRGEVPEMEQILLQATENTSHLRAVVWIGRAGRGEAAQITLKDKEHKMSNNFSCQFQNQPLLMLFSPCWVTGENPHAAPLCLHTPLVIKSWAGAEQLQLYLSFYLLFCYLTSPRSRKKKKKCRE